MPFWGCDYRGYTLTYIITNRYNNTIQFSKSAGELTFRFTHEFTPNHRVKEYGLLIHLGNNPSPIEPARQFRKWLMGQHKSVSLKEKANKVPKVKRLLGAPHIYL